MPEIQYWTSAAGVAILVASLVFLIGGLSRRLYRALIIPGLMLAAFALWRTAILAKDVDLRARDILESVNRALLPKTAMAPPLPGDAPAWLKIAYKEIGQAEIAGVEENARISEYFATVAGTNTYREDGDDWASAFVEWALQKAGKTGPKSMKPSAWLAWGVPIDQPPPGAIVILNFAGHEHVGFYFGEDGNFLKVLGGDQDDSVSIYLYPKSSVLAYRQPP